MKETNIYPIGTNILNISIKPLIMNNDDNKFQEQKAPLKNTDNAFVQVAEDGSPVMPQEQNEVEELGKEDSPTTLDDR